MRTWTRPWHGCEGGRLLGAAMAFLATTGCAAASEDERASRPAEAENSPPCGEESRPPDPHSPDGRRASARLPGGFLDALAGDFRFALEESDAMAVVRAGCASSPSGPEACIARAREEASSEGLRFVREGAALRMDSYAGRTVVRTGRFDATLASDGGIELTEAGEAAAGRGAVLRAAFPRLDKLVAEDPHKGRLVFYRRESERASRSQVAPEMPRIRSSAF